MGNYNQPVCNSPQISKSSIPEERIDELDKLAQELFEALCSLRKRLGSVIIDSVKLATNQKDCQVEKETAPCNSILNQRLRSLRNKYRDNLDTIHSLIDDIEL